jgi:hypothetical protein
VPVRGLTEAKRTRRPGFDTSIPDRREEVQPALVHDAHLAAGPGRRLCVVRHSTVSFDSVMRREPTTAASDSWLGTRRPSSFAKKLLLAPDRKSRPAPLLPARCVRTRRLVPMSPGPDEPSSEAVDASGTESMSEPELRREVWRLRDQVFGLEVERARLQSALLESNAARRAAQYRADTIDVARVQRDAMLESTRWKIGGAIVRPLRVARRLFSRAETRS